MRHMTLRTHTNEFTYCVRLRKQQQITHTMKKSTMARREVNIDLQSIEEILDFDWNQSEAKGNEAK